MAALVALVASAAPSAAEAQARGTLQATATVVDTRQGFGALDAARSAVRSATDSRIASVETVATVAQISVERVASRPGAIVVTIDYSRN
jgi:hypothetical protein